MCGIAGFISLDGSPVVPQVLEAMTQSLVHRGPDGFGIEVSERVGFGHRRLSIIDPEGGRQPMFNESRDVWLTFNGEIYNFIELRAELRSRGHVFRTDSDSEVIIHAYEEWEEECVTRLRGMFAFAIFDFRRGRLFISRDHFGIKPLFYCRTDTFFAFASEIQALKQIPGIRLTHDLAAMDQFLWLQYVPAPRTGFNEIKKLPPAHNLSVSLDGRMSAPKEYWELFFEPNLKPKMDEWVESLHSVLLESVRAHLAFLADR